ncbi:hypothetical protein ACHWQZ_G008394 [Mnemiopsis leidyi]
MAEKRKRRGNGLLKQLGIHPKPSTSKPEINKDNKEVKSVPDCSVQDGTTTRRSLRRKRRFLASIGVSVSKTSENSKTSISSVSDARDKLKENKNPSTENSTKSKSKCEISNENQKPKPKPKPSRSRNKIKAKNPKLSETSVLELTPLKSLKAVSTLGFIEDMSPMSFGTPAAKKKCSRKRDPMELSPTFRSRNYKSVLSKKYKDCPGPVAASSADLSVENVSEEANEEFKLRDVLPMRNNDSSEEDEDEYF